MHEIVNQLFSHLKAAWRYRWYAVIFAWIVAVGGWVVIYQIPDRYEASARVYVDTQSVLRPLLAGLAVQPNVDQLVSMMSRTLISRPNLEKVIRMSDMDIMLKTSDDREQMVSQLMKGLTIKSAGRENLYTIAYSAGNPQQAKRIVQSLLTIFVEGSLGDKRKDTDTAQRFIDEQLKIHGERLVAAETAVTEFKRKNMGLMGSDGRGYYERLREAQSALNQATLELKEIENSRDVLKKQLTGETPILLNEQGAPEAVAANSEIDGRLQDLQKRLDNLRLNYTEQHPDIVGILRIIDQLNAQKKAEAKQKRPLASSPTSTQVQSPVFLQLNQFVTEADARAAAMRVRVEEYQNRYNALKNAVNAVPQIEAEYTQLTRDYDVIKKNYDTLLTRRESAQMSGNMESSASVMDFRVIDPTQAPSVPSAPNRSLLVSLVLLGAIAGGVVLAILMNQIRPTFNNERRLREVTELPVFGTVAMVWTAAQRSSQKKRLVAFLLSFLSLFSAYAAIMVTLVFTAARA